MQTINIGIADDHRLFRKGIINLIQSFDGVNVVAEASNGMELLELLCTRKHFIDIILLDLNMPGMDGIQTMTRLRQLYPHLKIIILSLHQEAPLLYKLFEMGINAYLHKNCEIDEMQKAIYTVHNKDTYISPQISETLRKMAQHRVDGTSHADMIFLTHREKEVLRLICNEWSTQEIADKLAVSIRTVEGHRTNLLQKTGAKNTVSLLIYAIRHKLVDTDFLIPL